MKEHIPLEGVSLDLWRKRKKRRRDGGGGRNGEVASSKILVLLLALGAHGKKRYLETEVTGLLSQFLATWTRKSKSTMRRRMLARLLPMCGSRLGLLALP